MYVNIYRITAQYTLMLFGIRLCNTNILFEQAIVLLSEFETYARQCISLVFFLDKHTTNIDSMK